MPDCRSKRFFACIALVLLTLGITAASDGGASVYPAGVETVMPGMLPPPGGTLIEQFSNFYDANKLAGSDGAALVPGFHLRVGAVAPRVLHNWGVHLLGGTLVSGVAVPVLYIHLDAPFGKGDRTGVGNPDFSVAQIAYVKGNLHWYYGMDVFTPGWSYSKTALVNIGQHNYATAPVAAFTWLPDRGRTELSSKFLYIVNYTNPATNYRSGNEFSWEFDGMRSVTKSLAVGVNGFYYQQTTNDTVSGLEYLDGNRGRTVQFGPEIRYHFKHYAAALKYEKDFLTANRPAGNSLWLQFGIPLFGREEK